MEAKTLTLVERLKAHAASWMRDDAMEAREPEWESELLREAYEALEAAEKALEPFAEVVEWDIGLSESDDDIFRPMTAPNNRAQLLRVGDLRLARSVRDKIKGITNPVDPTPGERE